MLSKRFRHATALVGCVLLGGCSLFDPYVPVDNVHVAGELGKPLPPRTSDWSASQDLLKAEHDSAESQANAYRDAVRVPTRLKNGLAVGLPVLGSAVAIAAATHDRGDFPLIGGVVGATTLGVAGLLTSTARSAIYMQAQTATLCAMSAYDVYFINEDDYKNYLVDSPVPAGALTPGQTLTRDIAMAIKAEAAVKGAEDAYMSDAGVRAANLDAPKVKPAKKAHKKAAKKKAPVVQAPAPPPAGKLAPAAPPAARKPAPAAQPAPAQASQPQPVMTAGQKLTEAANGVQTVVSDLLNRADAELTAALATQTSLGGVRERIDTAGRSLGDRRMAIKTQVDQSLQTTELTVDQIKAAVSAAALASTKPTAGAPAAASGTKTPGGAAAQAAENPTVQSELGGPHALNLNAAMNALTVSLTQLQIDKITLDNWLARELQKEHDATQAGTCTASAQAVLTAAPPNPAQVASGKSLSIPIHAPTVGGAPTASKLEDLLTAVMTATGPYEYTLVISETGGTKPGTKAQTVVITSGAQSVSVPFSVTDALDTQPAAPLTPPKNGGSTDSPPPMPPPSQKAPPK